MRLQIGSSADTASRPIMISSWNRTSSGCQVSCTNFCILRRLGLFQELYSNAAKCASIVQPFTTPPMLLCLFTFLMLFVAHGVFGYTNPIKPGGGADPWVLRWGDFYYLTYTTGGDVQVIRSSNLAHFDGPASVVYRPRGNEQAFWAPELHEYGGAFYIYVAIAPGGANENHRMYVLKGTSSSDPTAPFNMVGQIGTPDNNWAIDGTILKYDNGRLYFIWSGWDNPSATLEQNLYIAEMDGPTRTKGNRVLLHRPLQAWQRSGGNGVNEGPQILWNKGRTFLVYSSAGSWTQDYNLALMGIDDVRDPLVPSNWWRVDDRPVFWKSNVAFGPGHASFPYDRNGQPFIVYHAMSNPNAGWDGRTIRAERFGWNPDNSPAFPMPAALGVSFAEPA